MSQLHTSLRQIFERLHEHDRRLSGVEIRGKVKEVDPKKAKVRLVIGKDSDGKDVLSPWRPYKQTSGALKIHSAPTVGQTMALRSESGDIEQGIAEHIHWNDDNKSPSDKQDENVLTFGDVTMTLKEGGFVVKIGDTVFDLSEAGFVQTGGKIEHDDHIIDKTHKHTEVVKGAAVSGPPE